MTTRLTNLRVSRVALVDRGADQDAHIVMFKRAPEEADELKRKAATRNTGGKEDGKMAKLNLEALPEALRAHFADVEIVQEAVDAIAASHTAATDAVPEGTAKELKEATDSLTAAKAELAEKNKKEDPEGEVTKGLSPEAAEMFKVQREQGEALQKRLDDEVEKREIRDFTEIAKSRFGNLPGADPEVMGGVLHRMGKNTLTDDDRTKLGEMLDGAANMANANKLLNQELGNSAPAAGPGDEQLESLSKAYQSDHPDVTPEVAMDKVLQTPAGRAAYTEGKRTKSIVD